MMSFVLPQIYFTKEQNALQKSARLVKTMQNVIQTNETHINVEVIAKL